MSIRDEENTPILTYRSFASVVGIVGLAVSIIVGISGFAAVLFLFFESRPIPAIMAALLSAAFAVVIAMLIPPTQVTFYNSDSPVLQIAQESNVSFPIVRFVVGTPEERVVARLRKAAWSRIGRNRWDILDANNRPLGFAMEESLSRAWMRKIAGKFKRRYESNLRLRYLGKNVGWIIRRPNGTGDVDVLEVTEDIDRRIAVALAALILGSEP